MDIGIFGASGLAMEVADICMELGYETVILIDKEEKAENSKDCIQGFLIVSETALNTLLNRGFDFIIAIGDPVTRRQVYQKFPMLSYTNIIHPLASFGISQKSGFNHQKGNIVFAGVRMTTNIHCGDFGIYNQNCTVAHDCEIADYVTIGPGANVSGNVHLSAGAYIGTGSTILQGASCKIKLVVGQFAIVGAGAVVTQNVADYQVVKGVPAR